MEFGRRLGSPSNTITTQQAVGGKLRLRKAIDPTKKKNRTKSTSKGVNKSGKESAHGQEHNGVNREAPVVNREAPVVSLLYLLCASSFGNSLAGRSHATSREAVPECS